LLASTAFPPHDGILRLDPRVETAQQEMYAALKAHGVEGDNNTADSWDAALITLEGLRQLGAEAGADDLRRWIAGLTDFPGTLGLYNFQKFPERGLGTEDSIVVRYEPAGPRWLWMSKLGGAPLD
jgi:ABC-type branched-subunit amino acid transport system substrate-binding protein